jgi:rhodanese-related sulfurtransferase
MAEQTEPRPADSGGLTKGIVVIALTGLVLGLGYNYLGLQGQADWGISWMTDPAKYELETLEFDETAANGAESAGAPVPVSDDPMAPVAGYVDPGIPQIPDLDRPVFIQMPAVKKLFDADAALILDAREPEEFAEGHIPGALNLPFDEVITDPARLETLDPAGRAIVVYCGGGTCEVSQQLGFELIRVGHRKVVVFQGGYPEWQEAGYPTETGSGGA